MKSIPMAKNALFGPLAPNPALDFPSNLEENREKNK
jgi:hypothetical protein